MARSARFLGGLRIGPTATAGCACSSLAGSGALRALRPVKALPLGRSAGLADALGCGIVDEFEVVDEFEFVEGTFTVGAESRVPSLIFSSGGLELPTVLAPAELSRSTEDRLACDEDVSVGATMGAVSDGAPLTD